MPRHMQFRFPGRIELRYMHELPSVGEVVPSDGDSWRVVGVESDEGAAVCFLERETSCDAGQDSDAREGE